MEVITTKNEILTLTAGRATDEEFFYATRARIRKALEEVKKSRDTFYYVYLPVYYTDDDGQTPVNVIVDRTGFNLRLGCHTFDAKNTKKLIQWANKKAGGR